MKIIISTVIFLFVLFNIASADFIGCTSLFPCCCQSSPESGQKRCYVTGVCCNSGGQNEYWDSESCYNFDVWVSGSPVLIVGRETDVFLYIKNTGSLTDSYDINYEILPSNQLIIVNLDQTNSGDVSPDETKVLNPKVTVLFSGVSGTVNFTITSVNNGIQKSAVYNINKSDIFVSLSEFNTFFLIILILASVVIIKTKNLI